LQKTKKIATLILLAVLVLPMTIQIANTATTQAETMNIPGFLKVYAEPNPVGVGQPVYISMFFTKPLGTGGMFGASLYTNMSLHIVKPDGSNVTMGPYVSDTTGGVGGITYTPEVAGNYTVQAFYGGQVLEGINTYNILPCISEADTFTVQDEQIPGSAVTPLPTEYWSRPIYATNYAWAVLGGNWWGLGKPSFTDTSGYDASGNNFNPYTTAPNSAHIMWVKPNSFGGQVGLPVSGDQESQYTSTSILYRQFEPVILNGIIYYKVYTNTPTTETSVETPGWNAVDLRTGELVWHKDTKDTLDFGFVMQFHTIQEYGTQAFLVGSSQSPAMFSTGKGCWQLFDPMTGYFIANITDVPATTAAGLVEGADYNAQGAVYIYTTNTTASGPTLVMWNSTRCISIGTLGFFGPSDASAVTLRPSGNMSYANGYQWEVPIPTNLTNGEAINPPLSIAARTNEVILLRSYGYTLNTFANEFGEDHCVEVGMNATDGKLLWGPVNRTLPRFHEVPIVAAGDGYYVAHDKDVNEAYIYNLLTGDQIGHTGELPGNALASLARGAAIAYDKCYIWDFGGYVNAIDLPTGELAWTLEPRTAGYDTPYGIYPYWHFGTHSIADGKLFLSEGRMYDPPLFAGANKMAINCTDGTVVWSVLGTFARETSPIADGYMLGYNSYDAQIYCFGKGQTQTTADVRNNVVAEGSSVLITGTVLDKAPGTTDSDRTARFPNGVAAVSDESQSDWMEYVYMQQPCPANVTGVPVTVNVMDANGNYRTIGTTTTDGTGFYSYQWIPDIPGKFSVYVTFGGSESYWPSQASTAFAVDAAAATPEPTAQPTESVADQYFVPGLAAIIVVIVVIGAAIMLMLSRKP